MIAHELLSKTHIAKGIKLKTRFLLGFIIGCVTQNSWADTKLADALTGATQTVNQCSAIAKAIAAIPIPSGIVEARAAEELNKAAVAEFARMQPVQPAGVQRKQIDPALLKPISVQEQAFFTEIRAQAQKLAACGIEFLKINNSSPKASFQAELKQAIDKVASKPTPSDDDKKLAAAFMAYTKASEALSADIAAISSNVILQRYIGPTIRRYYLGQIAPL